MNSSLPTELLELKNQLDLWRAAHRKRARIPAHFYATAVSLLDRCSLSLICQQTRLRPASLRKHAAAEGSVAPPEEPPQPAFFHLPATALSPQTCAASSAARAPGTSAQESHARLLLDRSAGARLTLTLPTADWDRIQAMCLAFLGDR
jgi:hypothetical protein